MQVARKVIFYIFILTFLVLCPLIILYSLGYIFQPKKKEISQTGLIYLASIPSDANVYLGRSHYKQHTPTSITGLIPGQYQVSVRLRNYRSWERQVTIEPGKALAFKHILLLPKTFKKINLSPGNIYTDLRPIAGTNYFILQKGPRLKDFYVYNWKENTLRPIAQEETIEKAFTVNSVFVGNKSNTVIIYGGSLWNKKYFLADLDKKDFQLMSITDLFFEHPDSIIWSRDNLENVFAVYDNTVSRMDFRNASIYPKYFEKIKGFGFSEKHLYILDKDNVISEYTLDKKRKILVFKDRNLIENLFKKSRFYTIKALKHDVLLFWGNRGDLVVTMPPYRICDEKVVGVNYNKSNNKLLYWTKNAIWIADFNVESDGGSLFKERVQLTEVYNEGVNICQCFWVYGGAYALFRDKNNVYLLELAPEAGYHKENIVKVKEKAAVFYSEKTGFLYYIDPKGNLVKIEILPKEKFSLIQP